MAEIIGDAIDRLCAVEIRYRPDRNALPRGVVTPLFKAARRIADAPMSYRAARGLIERIHPGDRVFIVCGSGTAPFLPYGETDGPLGGASIARALDLGLGAKPILISESNIMGANQATFEAAGLAVHDYEIFVGRAHSALKVEFPYGMNTLSEVNELFERYQPKAIIFVERTGPNQAGIYHTIRGTAKQAESIIANHLFAEVARERSVFSVGVGDGGNEIGFGNIWEQVRAIQPAGIKCLCPCGQGVATVVKADVLVVASISNWGAYGIAAMIGYFLERPELIQDSDMEYRMLQACVAAGGSDGFYASPTMYVDGISWRSQMAMVTMLGEIVTNGITQLGRDF